MEDDARAVGQADVDDGGLGRERKEPCAELAAEDPGDVGVEAWELQREDFSLDFCWLNWRCEFFKGFVTGVRGTNFFQGGLKGCHVFCYCLMGEFGFVVDETGSLGINRKDSFSFICQKIISYAII